MTCLYFQRLISIDPLTSWFHACVNIRWRLQIGGSRCQWFWIFWKWCLDWQRRKLQHKCKQRQHSRHQSWSQHRKTFEHDNKCWVCWGIWPCQYKSPYHADVLGQQSGEERPGSSASSGSWGIVESQTWFSDARADGYASGLCHHQHHKGKKCEQKLIL